jgi:RHS repeat-associated protein
LYLNATDSVCGMWGYDEAGNLASIVDQLGHITRNRYDSRNRLVQAIDAEGGITTFAYDLDNNLTSITDPVNNRTTYTYDARSRLVSETDPLNKATRYQYDAGNNLTAKIDRNNRRTEFNYDDIDRVIQEKWMGTDQAIDYTYDKESNLVSIIDKYSSLTFTYDNRDRVKSVDNNGTPNAPRVVLAYTYDGVGNILSVTDTINGSVGGTNNYTYDALNRLVKLSQTGNGVSAKRVDFAYNAIGQYTSVSRYGNLAGTSLVDRSTYAYDSLNRLTNLTHNNGSANIAFYNYTYDVASRITRITDIDGVTDYTYDDRNQLTGADSNNANRPDESYTYDANGNRTNTGYQTATGNRLTSDGTYTYEYDNEGNLVQQIEIATGKVRSFQWDYHNRLVGVVDKNASGTATQQVEFTYDAFDRRISKEVDTTPLDANDGVVTHFVYNGDDVHLEFVDSDGATGVNPPVIGQRYLHGSGIDEILAQESGSGQVLWTLTDRLGTVRDLVDSSGDLVNHFVYDSFGRLVSETDPNVDTRYGYTGREFDSEIGLQYNRARYYDPDTGRFIGEDPIGLAGENTNFYGYVNNNPISFIDPLGLVRPLDPNSQECKDLAKKIDNIKKDIEKRKKELQDNPNNLPEQCPIGKPRDSQEGHRKLIEELEKILQAREELYRQKCSGNEPSPEPEPEKSPNDDTLKQIVLIIGTIILMIILRRPIPLPA